MSDIAIQTAEKPPLEVALGSNLPSAEYPLVVVNPGHIDSTTVIVLRDDPGSFYEQTAKASPNAVQPVQIARKLLMLEQDPDCATALGSLIGRSEGRVAVCLPGEINMPKAIVSKLGTVSLRAEDARGKERLAQRAVQVENMTANVRPERRPYFVR